jgi:two-component system, sensor histidine kinase
LVELHGGTVLARSQGLGRGSEFIVDLPLAAARTELSHIPARSQSNANAGATRTSKVLIADDNVDSAESWAAMLQMEGLETRVVFAGADAVRAAAEFMPDVVLLDIGMPELNGYEVARRLRTKPIESRALLIAITGWGQPQDRQAALEAGFDAHLTKPVQLTQILELIASHEKATAAV